MNSEDPYVDIIMIREGGLITESAVFGGGSSRRAEKSTNFINKYLRTKKLDSIQYDYEYYGNNEMQIAFFQTTLNKTFEGTGTEIEWLEMEVE